MGELVQLIAVLIPIVSLVSVFSWLYLESKDRNKTILEISKNLEDPSKIEDLINLLDERKKGQLIIEDLGLLLFLLALAFSFLVFSF